jgi:predicted O-methyltransferase YrrM
MTTLRLGERSVYYRSRFLRELQVLVRWPGRRRDRPDVTHLEYHEEGDPGPLQRDEALLLHALVRVIRPRTVVELGFFQGHSAFNFLRALDADARLYSFDVEPACAASASQQFGHDPRFTFRLRSQTELTSADIDERPADFVFFDAAHELDLNQTAFQRLLPLMSPDAILAVHDTGTVPRALFPPWHWLLRESENWVEDEYEHQPDERAFVNWILERHSEFAQIHLHSRRTVRCGLTLLQRSAPLARPADATTG